MVRSVWANDWRGGPVRRTCLGGRVPLTPCPRTQPSWRAGWPCRCARSLHARCCRTSLPRERRCCGQSRRCCCCARSTRPPGPAHTNQGTARAGSSAASDRTVSRAASAFCAAHAHPAPQWGARACLRCRRRRQLAHWRPGPWAGPAYQISASPCRTHRGSQAPQTPAGAQTAPWNQQPEGRVAALALLSVTRVHAAREGKEPSRAALISLCTRACTRGQPSTGRPDAVSAS